ncbi:hypothetical protein ACP26L_36225 (plasmid) [Paenibacillus sp. S-38]|uniref:hypothetical protein n=1 Tax=Paenibacillus sp. S-38 TaxID=3416710 RepID=UPI003CE9FFF4
MPDRLRIALDMLDGCQELECDGMTRIISGLLQEAEIGHYVVVGGIEDTRTGKFFRPHMWIDLEDGRRIDYRARMWFKNDLLAPHGVFRPEENRYFFYSGNRHDPVPGDAKVGRILSQHMDGVPYEEVLELLRTIKVTIEGDAS